MSQALLYSKEMFVSMDETSCDRRASMRKYGYALRGEIPEYHRILVRCMRISAIAAIAIDLTTESVNLNLSGVA